MHVQYPSVQMLLVPMVTEFSVKGNPVLLALDATNSTVIEPEVRLVKYKVSGL